MKEDIRFTSFLSVSLHSFENTVQKSDHGTIAVYKSCLLIDPTQYFVDKGMLPLSFVLILHLHLPLFGFAKFGMQSRRLSFWFHHLQHSGENLSCCNLNILALWARKEKEVQYPEI